MKYDVVKDYDWTSVPRGSGLRKRAPRVWVKSYKLNSNQILNRFQNYLRVGAVQSSDEFYDKLYGDASTPEDDFNFPFFGDSVRSFTNTFGDTFQNGFGEGGGVGGAIDNVVQTGVGLMAQGATAVGTGDLKSAVGQAGKGDLRGAAQTFLKGFSSGGDPGSYIETPKFYQYEQNDGPLQVSFVLSNTINGDWQKNHDLYVKWQKINRPYRKNSIAMEPPRIFQVKVPGHRFIKWAYCSSFDSLLLGTKREIGGVIVPEAYQFNMSFQSLTVEAANFMDKI